MITLALDMPPEAGAILAVVVGIGIAVVYLARLLLPKSVYDFLAGIVKSWLESRK